MKAWFRTIAAMFSSVAIAQSVAGISLLALAIYTGLSLVCLFFFFLFFTYFDGFNRRLYDS
jgi:ABC-type multidrug transport system permease subunit